MLGIAGAGATLGATPGMTIRYALERFFSHLATELLIAVLILCSVALLILEASLAPGTARTRVALANDLVTALFALELVLRFYAERSKRRFFRRFWLDILAVLPLFRGLRLLRLFRLLRLGRVGGVLARHSRLFLALFRYVKFEYVVAALAIAVSVLMGALTLRFGEGREAAVFSTLEEAVWFAVMTTVAGEPTLAEPTTRLGRLVTLMLMLGGMTLFAFFAGTVSAVMIESLRKLRSQPMDLDELKGHVVICGWNRAGPRILDELTSDPDTHIVIVAESEQLEDASIARAGGAVSVIRADFTAVSVLKQAGVERASFAILLADESRERSAQDRDARTVLTAMLIERLNERIYTTVQLLNRDNEVTLRQSTVEDVVVSDEHVGGVLASVVRNRGIVPLLDELLTARYGQQLFKCAIPKELVGMRVQEALAALKVDYDATLIAIETAGPPRTLQINPARDVALAADARIVVAAKRPPGSAKA